MRGAGRVLCVGHNLALSALGSTDGRMALLTSGLTVLWVGSLYFGVKARECAIQVRVAIAPAVTIVCQAYKHVGSWVRQERRRPARVGHVRPALELLRKAGQDNPAALDR